MKTSTVIFLALVGVLCIVSGCDALKCYSCYYNDVDGKETTGSTTACGDGDKFDKSKLTTVTCSSNQRCSRSHSSSEVTGGEKTTTISRGCAKICANLKYVATGYNDGKEAKIDTSSGCCNSDECNAASTIGYLGLHLALTLLVTVYLKF